MEKETACFDWGKSIKNVLKAEVVMFYHVIRTGKKNRNRNRNIVGTGAE